MKSCPAFTLVELVVVVLIVGILAAVAVPKVLNNTTVATDDGLRRTLATIREGLDMWQAQYGSYPAENREYEEFVETRLRGQTFPACPVGKGIPTSVRVVSEGVSLAGTGGNGDTGEPMRKYDNTTGEIIVNYHAPSQSGEFYDEW